MQKGVNTISALEAFKIKIILEGVSQIDLTLLKYHFQMIEKLRYLQNLKNSMGEEMAEMMSEEITKVMNE